ncbi:hypothetical protein [Morganella morganii]|nr:hypothetical protein [Morganella morganii]WOZ90372.1 hypothetical protein PSP90_19975 [Morganella morganii]
MSDKMIAAAKAFAKREKTTFPIMSIKDLGYFIEAIRTERLKQVN